MPFDNRLLTRQSPLTIRQYSASTGKLWNKWSRDQVPPTAQTRNQHFQVTPNFRKFPGDYLLPVIHT